MRAILALLVAAIVSAPTEPQPSARFDWFEYSGNDNQPVPRRGEYLNPILQGFYPDPSITTVGKDFYLVTSTFAWFPGIPVFHSRDLVNWTQIGNALDRPDQLDFGKLGLSRGVFAPTIERRAGTYYILNTCVDCGGNFVITAKNPAGPWSDPVWLPEIEGGIDPSLFFDSDGSAWILNNGPPAGEPLYEGHRALWIQRFDTARLKMVGPRKLLVNGGVDFSTKPIWIEGPHILRKNGWYYLLAAEGGTSEGHSQVALRSRRVTGPYKPFSGNPILTQRDLPAERANRITSAGHADMVRTSANEWWATFLAVRPYHGDYYNTGREVFLMPVRWTGGWPRMTRAGQAIPAIAPRPRLPATARPRVPTNGAFTVLDEFDGAELPFHWMMMRNPRTRWWSLRNGGLALQPRSVRIGDNGNPSLVARRQQHMNATATTSVQLDSVAAGTEAGLVAMQSDDFWYFLSVSGAAGQRVLKLRSLADSKGPRDGAVVAQLPIDGGVRGSIQLRIAARADKYDFHWSPDGKQWRSVATGLDGTVLSTKRAGGFVGAMFGLHAYRPELRSSK